MRTVPCVVVSAALVLWPCLAHGGAANLNWGTVCYTQAPARVMEFACDTNDEGLAWPMTVSFVLDEPADATGFELELYGCPPYSQRFVYDWWRLGATECRSSYATYTLDKSAVSNETCRAWLEGVTAQILFAGTLDDVHAVIVVAGALAPGQVVALDPGVEYYACTVTIRNGRTAGAGACAGCTSLMNWYVDGLKIDCPGKEVWAGSYGEGVYWNHQGEWCHPDAVHSTTWGQIKSLYR